VEPVRQIVKGRSATGTKGKRQGNNERAHLEMNVMLLGMIESASIKTRSMNDLRGDQKGRRRAKTNRDHS
jgi:hypothetical protein